MRWVGESIGWEPVGLRVSGGFGKSREKSQSHREVLDDQSVWERIQLGKRSPRPQYRCLYGMVTEANILTSDLPEFP